MLSTARQQVAALVAAAETLLAQPLHIQQHPVAQNIQRHAVRLAEMLGELPDTELAWRELVPILSHDLLNPLTPIVGYAFLLRDYPAQFGVTEVSPQIAAAATELHEGSLRLQHAIEAVKNDAQTARQIARDAAPHVFDVAAVIRDYYPIWRWHLRATPVELVDDLPATLPIFAQQYHLIGIVQHIVLTIAQELVAYGRVHLRGVLTATHVDLGIFCTGLQLTDADFATLFEKQGRQVYHQQIGKQGGTLRPHRDAGVGATLYLQLPCAEG